MAKAVTDAVAGPVHGMGRIEVLGDLITMCT
jgi:hypothetical protein